MADRSLAEQIRRRILVSGQRYWKVSDFADEDLDAALVGNVLRRMAAAGNLERVGRGLYFHRGRSDDKRQGGPKFPSSARAVRAYLGDDVVVGPSGWHAANLLGLSTQVSPVEVLAISKLPPQNLPRVQFVDRSRRPGRAIERLNEREVAFLEALEGWDRYVELDAVTAVDRLVQLLREDDQVRRSRIVAASVSESPTVRERLRALLAAGGWTRDLAKVRRAADPRTRKRALRVLPEGMRN